MTHDLCTIILGTAARAQFLHNVSDQSYTRTGILFPPSQGYDTQCDKLYD